MRTTEGKKDRKKNEIMWKHSVTYLLRNMKRGYEK